LMQRFDPRWLIGIGFALFATSNFMNAWMTPDYAGEQLMWPNVVRAVGQALAFAPLIAVANGGIEPANACSASAIFNMGRNLGGAIGIATLQTFVTRREQFHSNVLMHSVSSLSEATRERVDQLTQYFLSHGVSDPTAAAHQAIAAIGNTVRRQAFVMAFSDTFFLLGVALVAALIAAMLLKKPQAA
jgi:MFS transporter, DHA2 family, multidrug resistance protein